MAQGRPRITLDDILHRFAPLAEEEPEPARTVRGTLYAVALDWLHRLPEGPARDKAFDSLEETARLAVEAATASAC